MTAKLVKQNIIEVGPRLIDRIQKLCEHHTYSVESELYYEGQTPVVAYLLLSGDASLFKKRRKSIPLKPGCLFGLKELILHQQSVYGAKIGAGSEVCFLDRSTVKEIIDLEIDQDLKQTFELLLLETAG